MKNWKQTAPKRIKLIAWAPIIVLLLFLYATLCLLDVIPDVCRALIREANNAREFVSWAYRGFVGTWKGEE